MTTDVMTPPAAGERLRLWVTRETTGGALLSVIPLAILILVLQRFWRGGLTEGSVKG